MIRIVKPCKMIFRSASIAGSLHLDNAKAHREPDLSAIRWSRLLGTIVIFIFFLCSLSIFSIRDCPGYPEAASLF